MYNETISKELCKHIRFYVVKSPDNEYNFYIWAEKDIELGLGFDIYSDRCNVNRYVAIINNILTNKVTHGFINYKCIRLDCITTRVDISKKYLVYNYGNRTIEFIYPLLIKPSQICIEMDCSDKFYLSINIDKILDASIFSCNINRIKHRIGFNPYNYEMQVQERAKNIVSNQNLLCTKEDKSIEDMYNDIWDNKEKSSLNKEVNCMNNKLEYKELEIPEKLCKHIRFYAANSPSGEGFYIWADIINDHNMNNTEYFMVRRYVKLINKAIYEDICTGYLHPEKIKITSSNKNYCKKYCLVIGECTNNRIKDNPLLIIPSNIIIEQEGDYHYISIDIDIIYEINAKEHESCIVSMIGFNPYKNNATIEYKLMKFNEKDRNGRIYSNEIIVDSLPGGSRVNKLFGSIDFNIKKVIHNNSATIVFWETGDKTVVKKQKGEKNDIEKAIMAAYMKKALSRGSNAHERSTEEVLDKVKSDLAQQQQQNDKKSKKKKK